jgi:hypothetical protein
MMGKRLLVFITFLLVSGLIAGWYFFVKESRYIGTSPLNAVPVEAPFFIRIRQLGDFASKTVKKSGWQAIRNFSEVSELDRGLVFIDSLIQRNNEEGSFLMHKELIIVPVASSKLYLLQIGSIPEKNNINSFIRNYFFSKNIAASIQEYKDASLQLYEWVEKGENRRVVIALYRGMLMVCNEAYPLTIAIDQMDKPSVLNDPDYQQVNKNSTENIDLNIFINHHTFPAYLSGFYADSLALGVLQPNYAKWTEVDVILKENQLLVNGFTVSDTVSSCYLDVFKHQVPLVSTIGKFLPATATYFVAQNLSDPKQYFEDYNGYLQKCSKLLSYSEQLSLLSDELKADIRKYLTENWTGEIAAVYTGFNLEEPSDNRFLLMKVKTGTNDPLAMAVKKNVAAGKKNLHSPEEVENDRNSIWPLPSSCKNFGNLIGESYFGSIQTKWIYAGNGFILMGASPGSLKRYLNLLQRNELLAEDSPFLKFSSGLSRTSNFYLWCKPGHSLPFFEPLIRTAHYQELKNEIFDLKKIENIAWQWGYENGMVYNTASMNINPTANQNKSPFWRYPLKAKMRNIPVFVSWSVKNDVKDLVFQDFENNLVDLDKDGTERWKIQMESPVMGKVKLIDYYKNGDFQLIFNTRESIHLVDRNGAEVKNYPIRLKSGATNEVSIFDYDGKKDYRYLVACNDHKVYNFEKNGKLTSGWQVKTTQGIVEFPVHHFRVGSKDYVVFFDHNKTYVLDRFGKERVRLKEEFTHSKNDLSMFVRKDGSPCMVTTDARGKIRIVGFDGSVKKIALGNFSPGHSFLPVDNKSKSGSDFLILDQQVLSRYEYSGNLIFTHPVKVQRDQAPAQIVSENENMVELYSATDNRTFLIRKDGSVFDNFLPEECSLLTIGSFNNKTSVRNMMASGSDGYLSNFQMILP